MIMVNYKAQITHFLLKLVDKIIKRYKAVLLKNIEYTGIFAGNFHIHEICKLHVLTGLRKWN